MEDNFVNEVIELYKNKRWKDISEKYHDFPDRNKLLWVYPNEQNFNFLKTCLLDLGCDNVLSVGCGSGLLEWMFSEATSIPIKGIEIDSAWWRCKYAPPNFIPLIFTPTELDKDILYLLEDEKSAVLFCYFNNRDAFNNYLNKYRGNVLIIVGPGHGKGVHTDPKPFDDVGDYWKLYKWQEVRQSKDFIAVYCKVKTK